MAANIKTREVVKGTIKTLDKSQITAARMKQSYMKTKERAESATHVDESSPSEYAVNSASVKSETIMREVGHKSNLVGRRSAEVTKQNLIKAREGVMQRRTTAVMKPANTVKWKVSRKPLPQNAYRVQRAKGLAIRNLRSAKVTVGMLRRTVLAIVNAFKAAIAGTRALISAIIAGGWIAVLVIIICCLFGAALFLFGGSSNSYTPVSPEVEAYSPTITKYVNEYGISEYAELIKAVMMHESSGKGTDPMDSSGFSYNTKYPEGITDPNYSIKCGVQKLANLISKNKCESALDMSGIRKVLEGYNAGDDDETYVNNVLKYYPYGNFSDEVLILGTGELGLPINGMTQGDITSHFGGRESPGGIGSTNHKGLDIGFTIGTKVYACEKGTVIHAGWSGGFGKLVIVDHGNGMQTYYAHLNKINIAKGMKVVRGQNIGEVGNTGNSTGPHLHLGVMVNGSFVNPEKLLTIPK